MRLNNMKYGGLNKGYTNVKGEDKNYKPWSQEDIEKLKLYYYTRRYSAKGVASLLGRTENAVVSKLAELKRRRIG